VKFYVVVLKERQVQYISVSSLCWKAGVPSRTAWIVTGCYVKQNACSFEMRKFWRWSVLLRLTTFTERRKKLRDTRLTSWTIAVVLHKAVKSTRDFHQHTYAVTYVCGIQLLGTVMFVWVW